MKKYTMTLALLVVSAVGTQSLRAMEPNEEGWLDWLFSAKGIAAASAVAGGYYAYNDQGTCDAIKDKYTQASQYVDGLSTAQKAYAGLGAAAVGYGLWRWYNSGSQAPAVYEPDPNAAVYELEHGKGTARNKVPAGYEQVPGWLAQLANLLEHVFASIENRQDRINAIKPYIQIAAKDPHALLAKEDLIERLTAEQKVALLSIFGEFFADRIVKTAQELMTLLNENQDGTKALLEPACTSGDIRGILGALKAVHEGGHLTKQQDDFVNNEIARLGEWEQIRNNFLEIYKAQIDEFIAHKSATDPAFREAMERGQQGY